MKYDGYDLVFSYEMYPNDGIYIGCETDDGLPYADISVWVDISPLLAYSNEIVIPTYKLSKDFLEQVEGCGFMKIDYDRTVKIGYSTGCIAQLAPNYKEIIDRINDK